MINKLPNPCTRCSERHIACHSNCYKHKAYIKISHEIQRRIDMDIKGCSRIGFKPVLYQINAKA